MDILQKNHCKELADMLGVAVQRLPIADAIVKVYFYVDTEGHIKAKVDENSVFDLTMYDYGNYFSNRSQAVDKIEEMLEKLWKTKGEKEG